MGTKERILLFLLVCSLCQFCISASYPDSDTILQGQELRDWDHLISANRNFRLHFFSPSPSTPKNRYLGISFNRPDHGPQIASNRKVVWVANRNTPIPDASGTLTIDSNGTLKIMYGGGGNNPIILNSVPAANNASATLLDSGNFVLRELNSDRVLWQSFDYPTDTLLPGMKLGINFKTDHVWSLISWISFEVPAPGSFTFGVDPNKTNQLIIWWQGRVYWTSGPWQGNGSFEFAPRLSDDEYMSYTFVSNENEKYFTFSVSENRPFHKYAMDPFGTIVEQGGVFFGFCSFDDIFENSAGCVKEEFPDCRTSAFWFDRRKGYVWEDGLKFHNLSLFDCQNECLKNCSCGAYGSISANGTGCETWRRGMSFHEYDSYSSREVYILPSKKVKWWIWLIIAIAGVLVMLLCCSFCYLVWRKFKGGTKEEEEITLLCELAAANRAHSSKSKKRKLANEAKETQEWQLFDFESITASTDNFAAKNMLGKGGFGPVYKGKLNGQEVAIKRLSRSSGQGVVEFKNELTLVAKLQHNNLVRVIGCCIKREEKILVYEYMPNKSLDFFLFDSSKKNILDWKTRCNIIEGIAQGLIYLHKYSRLRIIHRDLKAGNILLDGEMNPKISDFGMARIFGGNDCKANTNRVVGTYGYMSPEYAMEGIFSIKSDVFSFGVLLLEIVSGEKNNSHYHPEHPRNLTGYAWELWREGRGLELVDPSLNDTYQSSEVLRCVHVGLLCVQENPNDRPTMLDVVSMIFNESVLLPTPKPPAFFIGRSSQVANMPRRTSENCSLNNVTISEMEAAR